MAITVNTTPDTYAPTYNPVGFNVESTNYAQSNFEFVADIYINSAASYTRRLKFPAYPGQNYGFVDIGGVLKDYLTSDVYGISDQDFKKNANSILRYDVQWGESYGPSSGVTVYNNLTSSNGYAFNGSLEHINLGNQPQISDWVNWTSSEYRYGGGTTYFLTNAPRINGQGRVSVKLTEGYALYFLNDTTNSAFDCQVAFYTSGNVFISASVISNSFTTVGLYDTRYLRVNVGPLNLSGGVPATAAYYLVGLRDNATVVTSEIFRFDIDTTCSNATRNYRFIFKNRMGGFDSFTFMGQYERTTDIRRDFFKTIGGTWSGGLFSYGVGSRGEKQYNTVGNDSFKCQSGWITEAQSDWLSELIDSPEVYIYHPDVNTNTPVNIIDSNYPYKTVSRDGLFNIELTFKPTFNKVRQQF